MTTLARLLCGAAAAACVPGVAQASLHGRPQYLLIGALAGALPGLLACLWPRRRHAAVEIVPDPADPDWSAAAAAVAEAVRQVAETRQPVDVHLHPVRGTDGAWLPCAVEFDLAGRAIRVGSPGRPDRFGEPRIHGASAALPTAIRLEHTAVMPVVPPHSCDFSLEPLANAVQLRFAPERRAGSHSLAALVAASLLASALGGWHAGAAGVAGVLSHLLVDQASHLGCCWWRPWRTHRAPGWRCWPDDSPTAAFWLAWGAALVLAWSLAHAGGLAVKPLKLLAVGLGLPLGLFVLARSRARGSQP